MDESNPTTDPPRSLIALMTAKTQSGHDDPFSCVQFRSCLIGEQSVLEHQSLLLTPRPLGCGEEILDRQRAWPAVGDEPLQNNR
jgi:hypothetical protein